MPEDLQSILNDSTFFSSNADITTKEILKRYGDIASKHPVTFSAPVPNSEYTTPQSAGSQQPIVHRVDSNDIANPSAPQPHTSYASTPPLQPPMHNGFYANMSTGGSRDSFGMNGAATGRSSPRFGVGGRI